MKKKQLLSTLFLSIAMLTACKKDNPEAEAISISFHVKFDEQAAALGLSPANTEITITNQTNGLSNKGKTDASGNVKFESITPGNYSVVSSLTISAADYSIASGSLTQEDVVFNANLNQFLNKATGNLELVLKTGRLGDWLLKQIYYGGSHTINGAVFRDQFIEIYNNSNAVMYADSLYIGLVAGVANTNSDVSKSWFLPSGQYNWTDALNMNNAKANTDYVYLTTAVRIPGNGKQYPVQPGTSIIIAQNAINHKVPYTDNAGKAISVKNPELTVDLSKADFEVYYGDQPGINRLSSDIDNPLVPNLEVIYRVSDRDFILDNNGREAVVLFKTTANLNSYPKFPTPNVKTITGATSQYIQMPTSILIDGAEMAYTLETKRVPHRLPATIDAGFTFSTGGPYSSQSVIRKTSKTVNGRRILKDSNNSSLDFESLTKADPSKAAFK
jgi:hypothetical protein